MDLKELLGDAYKEDMTLTDIAAALKDKKLVDPSTLPESVAKATFDKTASELADAKKKLKEKLTADEQAKADQDAIKQQLDTLTKENSRFKFEKEFLASGYDAKTAAGLAEAMAGGDMKKFAEVHKSYAAAHETELRASIKDELLKGTPGLQNSNTNTDPNGGPSLGEQAAQAYNSQFAPAQTAPTGAPQGK